MKNYYYLLFFFLIFSCQKKSSRILASQEEIILETRALGTFSRFENDYYFWNEPQNFQHAALSFLEMYDQNGQKLSGRYKVTYGVFDDILEDGIISSTLITENISFFNGAATFAIDLEEILINGNLQNVEKWFWFEFIIQDRNNVEVARAKIGTLIKKKKEFRIRNLELYSLEDHENEIEIAVDISDPLFQFYQDKGVSPSFWVKFNDELPKLYNFEPDYSVATAYLTLKINSVPVVTSDTRLLVWHQADEMLLVSKVRIGQKNIHPSRICVGIQEEGLSESYPFNLADYIGRNEQNHVIQLYFYSSPLKPEIQSFPPQIQCFIYLQTLYISGVGLLELPDNLGKLKQLEELFLYYNPITRLPNSFADLLNLRSVEFHFNELNALPENFGYLTKLISLHLQYNQFTDLPESFGDLINLETLTINSNLVSNLDLDRKKPIKLPQSFSKLKKLKQLSLAYLEQLPDNFGPFPNLDKLDISDYIGNTLPIINAPNLKYLKISGSRKINEPVVSLYSCSDGDIKTVPYVLCKSRLKLNAYHGPIILSEIFSNLSKLETLILTEMPIQSFSKNVLANLIALKDITIILGDLTTMPDSLKSLCQRFPNAPINILGIPSYPFDHNLRIQGNFSITEINKIKSWCPTKFYQ